MNAIATPAPRTVQACRVCGERGHNKRAHEARAIELGARIAELETYVREHLEVRDRVNELLLTARGDLRRAQLELAAILRAP